MQESVRALRLLLEDGYGGNGLLLLEELRNAKTLADHLITRAELLEAYTLSLQALDRQPGEGHASRI